MWKKDLLRRDEVIMSSSWWTKRPETDMFDAFRDMMLSSNNTRDQRIPKRSPPKSVDVHLGPRLSCKTRGTQHSVPSSQKQQFEWDQHCVRTKLSRCGGIVRCSPTTNPQLPLPLPSSLRLLEPRVCQRCQELRNLGGLLPSASRLVRLPWLQGGQRRTGPQGPLLC